jgi:hypothetical protein
MFLDSQGADHGRALRQNPATTQNYGDAGAVTRPSRAPGRILALPDLQVTAIPSCPGRRPGHPPAGSPERPAALPDGIEQACADVTEPALPGAAVAGRMAPTDPHLAP